MHRSSPLALFLRLIIALSYGLSANAFAADAHIQQVTGKNQAGFYYIDAKLDIRLSDSVREALTSGIPLTFVFDIELTRPTHYLWDEVAVALRRPFTLQRNALAKRYVVTDVTTERQVTASSIDEALLALTSVSDITVGREADLKDPKSLHGRLRVQLDIESLPPPLRPIAYISPSWHIRSGWYEWTVSQ